MNLPAALFATRWFVRDTFRQARASGILGLTLLATAVCVTLCLSVSVVGEKPALPLSPGETREYLPRKEAEKLRAVSPPSVTGGPIDGVEVPSGELTIGFGAFRIPQTRDRADGVRFIQALLAGFVADTAGILLILVWTAGFLPAFLAPAAASVLLVKPVPRWTLLAGKFFGVLAFVTVMAAVFVVGTWLALGLRTDVWEPRYLLTIPLLLLHFLVFFSASCLLAVWTRSTVACGLGTLLFWFLCWGVNYGRHGLVVDGAGGVGPSLVEAAYWLLPKPADLGLLLLEALRAGSFLTPAAELQQLIERGLFHPEWSVITSLAFPAVAFLLTARAFVRTDY
jgi:hypothetical protein